jgi:hypothetical protein
MGRKTRIVVNVLEVMARHLARAVEHCGQLVLAERSMAVDVLEDDDRVVHDAPHGDGEPAQSHHVERDVGELHQHERGQDGQRNADRRDERRAEAEEEQEDRDDSEQRAKSAFAQQAVLRLDDEVRQVLDNGDLHFVRVRSLCVVKRLLDGVGDLNRVR